MTKVFVNKDAQFIHNLAAAVAVALDNITDKSNGELSSRLLVIANNIEGLDNKSLNAYSKGFTDGRNSAYARSNVVKEDSKDFTSLAEAIADFKGEVKKVPTQVKQEMKPELTLDDLDLEL